MADRIALQADTGRQLGSAASRRLRREGRIPAVVYGLDADPLSISVDYSEARVALTTDAGLNALLDVAVGDESLVCVVKDIQRHVTRDEVLHIDFLRVDPNAVMEVEVPIVLVGDARAVTDVSGMVDQNLFALAILTKPTDIPNEIEVDISAMTVGDTIRVEDVALPAGMSAVSDAESTIATAMVTRSTIEAMAAEDAAEAEEGAEAAAPADADADGGDDA